MRSIRKIMTMELEYCFTNKEVTPYGGMVFLKQFMDKIGIREQINNCDSLPQPESNRGYDVSVILESFICSIWCGSNRFLHTEINRQDNVLRKIFGWKQHPGQDVYKRYFGKFTQKINQEVSDHFYKWVFSNLKFKYFTLDLDSSVITRYGEQEGAKRGYNPNKKGRNSHHPIMAFVNDFQLIANMWLRSGDTADCNNFLAFLEDTLQKLEDKIVSLIRLDSGFFTTEILDYLEKREKTYIVAAKFYHPVQRVIDNSMTWVPLLEDPKNYQGIEICDTIYKAEKWELPRRMIIVRQKIAQRKNAIGKTLSLFPEDEFHRNYRYSAYITNSNLAASEIWRLYRGRGDAENRIKEIKYDFGFDSFNLKKFFPTEAALSFSMIAYNLMAIFRLFVLQEETQKRLATLRHRVFNIGAFFQKQNGKILLNIALTKKRRHWFNSLWNYPISFPIKIPNA